MTAAEAVNRVADKLAEEFDEVLPEGVVRRSVAAAVPPVVAATRPDVLEDTARTDLQALADAVSRSAPSAARPPEAVAGFAPRELTPDANGKIVVSECKTCLALTLDEDGHTASHVQSRVSDLSAAAGEVDVVAAAEAASQG